MDQEDFRGIRLEGHVHRKLMVLKDVKKVRSASEVIDELIDDAYPNISDLEKKLSESDIERQRLIDDVFGGSK